MALKVPNLKEYGLEDADGGRLDPVSENQSLIVGGAAEAFIDQDHKAHMTAHENFKQEIVAMGNVELAQKVIPLIDAHNAEHFGMDYRMRMDAQMQQTVGFPMPPYDQDHDEEVPAEIDMAVARAVAALAPPPAPQQAADPNAQADADAQREQDRKDMESQRGQDRLDSEHMAKLKREGLVSDEDAQAA